MAIYTHQTDTNCRANRASDSSADVGAYQGNHFAEELFAVW